MAQQTVVVPKDVKSQLKQVAEILADEIERRERFTPTMTNRRAMEQVEQLRAIIASIDADFAAAHAKLQSQIHEVPAAE